MLSARTEARYRKVVLKGLNDLGKKALKNIRKLQKAQSLMTEKAQGWSHEDIASFIIPPKDEFLDKMVEQFEDVQQDEWKRAYKSASKTVRLGVSFDATRPQTAQALAQQSNLIVGMGDKRYEDLKGFLGTNLRDGATVDELAKNLKGTFFGGNRTRAERVARTESMRTLNQGSHLAYDESDVVVGFEWQTVGDGAVRDGANSMGDHASLDGKTVPKGEPFKTNLAFPHDPSAPPEEVINCRCIAIPLTDETKLESAPQTTIPTTQTPEAPSPPEVDTFEGTRKLESTNTQGHTVLDEVAMREGGAKPSISQLTETNLRRARKLSDEFNLREGLSADRSRRAWKITDGIQEKVEQWKKTLPIDQRRAVSDWTRTDYVAIRRYQREGVGSANTIETAENLTKAMVSAPTFEGRVYRGLADFTEKQLDEFIAFKRDKIGGEPIELDAFSSSSLSSTTASGFAKGERPFGVVLKIDVKDGRAILGASGLSEEEEILLLTGSKYKVISVGEKGRRGVTIHLEEVTD